jgi:toxin ParE1/3/4
VLARHGPDVKRRDVVFSPEAEADLTDLFDFIAQRSHVETALNYISRIEDFCDGLDVASERGTLRNDIRDGLRIVGFERRLNIAFTIEESRVVILRFFSGGQNWESAEW